MTWLHKFFGLFFIPARRLSQIGPTADFDGAAIPPPIFSMVHSTTLCFKVSYGGVASQLYTYSDDPRSYIKKESGLKQSKFSRTILCCIISFLKILGWKVKFYQGYFQPKAKFMRVSICFHSVYFSVSTLKGYSVFNAYAEIIQK